MGHDEVGNSGVFFVSRVKRHSETPRLRPCSSSLIHIFLHFCCSDTRHSRFSRDFLIFSPCINQSSRTRLLQLRHFLFFSSFLFSPSHLLPSCPLLSRPLPSSTSKSDPGSHSGPSSPLPTSVYTSLHFYREKISPFSSLVDSRRNIKYYSWLRHEFR